MRRALQVGDRVLVRGGYDMDPMWLAQSREGYRGTVIAFVDRRRRLPSAVVALDEELVLPHGAGAVKGREIRGSYLVLDQAWSDSDWSTDGPRLHVRLLRDWPPGDADSDETGGARVESHADYCVITSALASDRDGGDDPFGGR